MVLGAGNQSNWRSTEGLRTALSGLFVLVAVANVAAAFAFVHRAGLIDQISNGTVTLREAEQADDFVRTATFVALSLGLVTGVLFIVWQWRTAKNAAVVLRRRGARYGPGWSIGGWFIPLANLVIPVLVMQDLWRSSDPQSSPDGWRSRPRSALVGWWWVAFVVAGVASRGSRTTDSSALSEIKSADNAAAFGVVMFAVAAILAMLVVRSITARQIVLRASLAEESSGGSASSASDVRCITCGSEYISGTVLCADCMGTDFRSIAEP
jgi:hypothetical protein